VQLAVVLIVGSALEVIGIGLLLPVVAMISGQDGFNSESSLKLFDASSLAEMSPTGLLIILFLVQVFKSVFLGWSIWYQRGVAQVIEVRLSRELLYSHLRKPFSQHLAGNSADLIRDIGSAAAFVSLAIDSFLGLAIELLTVSLLLALLVALDPLAAITVLVVIGSAAYMFHALTRTRIERWGDRKTELEARRIQFLQEGFRAITEIKVLNCEMHFGAKYERIVRQATDISRRFVTIASLPRIWLELLAFMSLTLILAPLTLRERSLLEAIPILAVFAAASIRIMPSISKVTLAAQNLAFGKSVIRIVEGASLKNGHAVVQTFDYVNNEHKLLQLKDVSFSYQSPEREVLKRVSLDVLKGSIVGIFGESGSGKSTLASVLLGLLEPTTGKILRSTLLQEQDTTLSTRRPIGYVPQVVYLADDSLKNNIAFGILPKDIDSQQVLRALEMANLSEFVRQLSHGIETYVGEAGARISGGQRQRVGLARALYGAPTLLVLDEFTSSLDKETESEVLSQVLDLKGETTIIIISHSPDVLAICDCVYEMLNGSLVERGRR